MKILFFSDVHGVSEALEALFRHADGLKPDRLVSLGDTLYHGFRKGMSSRYDSQYAADLLNARKDQIIAVRGNCDTEADQQLLAFPMLSDYAELQAGGTHFFLTHGDRWNERRLPPFLPPGSVLANGHTHVPELKRRPDGVTIFNPGSISLPRSGYPPTFGFFDGAVLSVRTLSDGAPYQGMIQPID